MASFNPEVGVFSWDDVRYFLAVARTGSINGAAKVLNVDHTTVGRRISALEGRLGQNLLIRDPRGIKLTTYGHRALREAEAMEQAHARFIAARSGGSLVLEGRIRLGITEGLASQWLIPGLSGFQSAHPALEVSFDAAHAFSGLGEQVDAAIRFSPPVELDEVGRRVGVLHFSLFAPKDYAARHGLPSAINELGKHRFVDHTVYRDHIPSLAPWTTLLAGLTVTLRTPNYLNVWAAMRQGLGMAVLPNYVVRAYPDLVKAPLDLGWRSDIWVIFREPARHVPRVRAVVEEIVRIGKRDQATFFES